MSLRRCQLAIILFLILEILDIASAENLFIGGIGQSADDQKAIKEFAEKNGGKSVPTYLGNDILVGVPAVAAATPQYKYTKDPNTGEIEVYDSYLSYDYEQKKAINGLGNDLLNEKPYDTIYAHSGGTRTAVTAMLRQGVTADTLVLISPIMGHRNEQEAYNWELQELLRTNKVKNIVVYQSSVDKIPWGNIYQAKFDANNPGIEGNFKVVELDKYADLKGKSNKDAHIQMWYTALEKEVGSSPTPAENFFSKAARNFGNLFKPKLSPTSTLVSSDQNKAGKNILETSGTSYNSIRQDPWYVDIYSLPGHIWEGDRRDYPKPPAPLYIRDGVLNTRGYDWIYLPANQRDFTWYGGYFEWVEDYLASIGQSGPSAGYGQLIDEGQSAGDGW